MTDKNVKFTTTTTTTTMIQSSSLMNNNGNNGNNKTNKPLSKEDILLQNELDKMNLERNDITSKARDIEEHLERAEYQLEENKKVNDLLTKAANTSEKLMIDIEKHSDATRKQIIDVDKSFTLGLKQLEESNDDNQVDELEKEEEAKMLEKDISTKMKEDYEKKLSSAVSNLTKLFSEGKKEYKKLELGPPPGDIEITDDIDIDQARIIIPQLQSQISKLTKDLEVADMKNRATYVQWYAERAKLDDFAEHCRKDVESITYRMIAAESKVRHTEQVTRDPNNVVGAVSRQELDDVLLECEKLRAAYVKEYEDKVRLQQLLKAAHHEIDEKNLLIQSLQHSKIELNMQMAQMTVKQNKLDEQLANMKEELDRMLMQATAEMKREFQREKDELIGQIDPLQLKLQHQKIFIDDVSEKLIDRNNRIEKLEQELETTKAELEKTLKLLASTLDKDLIMKIMTDINNNSNESMDALDKRLTAEIERLANVHNSLNNLNNMLLDGRFRNISRPPSERLSLRKPVEDKVESTFSIDENEIIDINEARVESPGFVRSPSAKMSPVQMISRSNSPVVTKEVQIISREASPVQVVTVETPIMMKYERPSCVDQDTQTEYLQQALQAPASKEFSAANVHEIVNKVKLRNKFDKKQLNVSENEFNESLISSVSTLGQIFSQNDLAVDEIMASAAENIYNVIMSTQEKLKVVERIKTPVPIAVPTSLPVEEREDVQKPIVIENKSISVSMVDDATETSSELWNAALEEYISRNDTPQVLSTNVAMPAIEIVEVEEEEEDDDDLEVTDKEMALRKEAQENLLGEMLQENFQRLIGKGFGSQVLVKLTLVNHHLAALTKEDSPEMTGNKLQISSMKVERKLLMREVIEATSIRELSAFKVETEKHIALLGTFNALKLLHHYKTGGIFLDVLNKHRSTIDDCIAASGGWLKAYEQVVESEESMASTAHWPDFFRLKVLEYLREKLFREKEMDIIENEAVVAALKEREINYETNIKQLEQERQNLSDKLEEMDKKKKDRKLGRIVSQLRRSSAQIVVPDSVYGVIALSSKSSTNFTESGTESSIQTLETVSETTESESAESPISKPLSPISMPLKSSTPLSAISSKPPSSITIQPTTAVSYTPVTAPYTSTTASKPTTAPSKPSSASSKPSSARVQFKEEIIAKEQSIQGQVAKEEDSVLESLRTLHKLINRVIIRLLNNDHEAQCLAEGILGALLAWKDEFYGDAGEYLNHCITHFPNDPEISVAHELIKLLSTHNLEFDKEVAEVAWNLEQMIIFHGDHVKKSQEIPLPPVVHENPKSKFGMLVHNHMQDIVKKNNMANEMVSHRIERQKALEEAKRKEEELLARWKHDLKIAVEKEIEDRRPDTIDDSCQTDPPDSDRDLEVISSREKGSKSSRPGSKGIGSRGGNRRNVEEESYEESGVESSQISISRNGVVGHPFSSPLPPGFHLVHFRDNEVELCPGIFLASASKHRIFSKNLPKKVVYIYRGKDAALLKGIKRLPSYISVPAIPDCEPVLIPPIFDLCDGVKLIHGSDLGEHNELELPPDILVVKMSRDAILPNGLTIVELSDIVKVPMTAEIPFGFELVQISTSVVLPPGVEISEGIFTAPCPKTLQLPPNVLLIKREETAKFPSFLKSMASTTYEEIEVSIHNKISQGCTLVCKPPGVPFNLGEEVLYRIPGHDIPAGMRHVCISEYPKGLHLGRNLEVVQLIPRFDLPDTCSPAPGWFVYPRPFGMRLPPNVHLFICEGDLNSGFIALPTCLREVSMPDIPPGMKIPKKVIAAEFFSDNESPLPEDTIIAPGIKVLSVRKYLSSLDQNSSYYLPLNAVLVERKPDSPLPEGVERGSCSDLPFGHLLGPCIEVLMLSVRFELPAGVKLEPHLVLGQRTQLAPGTILSRDLEVIEWPRFFFLPPGLELVRLKPGTDLPAGYVRAQIPSADPINKKIPVGCIIVHLPYIVAVPSLQQLTESIEIVTPDVLTANEKNVKPSDLPIGLILISRENRESILPGELKLAPKSSLPDKLKNGLAKYNINARYNSGAKLIDAVQLQPNYSLPPGTEIFQGVFILPKPHWIQLPNGAELVSIWKPTESNLDFIKKYKIDIRPDISPHSTINSSDVLLPEDFHVILLSDRYEVFSWQSIAPGIEVVSKPDNIILPPNHFLIQRSKSQTPPPGMKMGFAPGYERVGTRTKLPPGIEVMHLTASYSLPLGVDISNTAALECGNLSHNDENYYVEISRNERLSCGFTVLSNPYNFKRPDGKRYVFVAVDRNHYTWPKNSNLHPNSDEIVFQYFNHFTYDNESLGNMRIRRGDEESSNDSFKIIDYIKYIELPNSIPNIRSRLREEISIIKAFVESYRGQSVGQMSIEDILHQPTGSFSDSSDKDSDINATRAVVVYPRVKVEKVTIQTAEQKFEAKKDFSKLEISNALISHFVDDDGEPLEIDEKLLMKIIESFKSEIGVLEKENNEYRLKFTTLHRDHEQLKIRFGRLQTQQATHADELLEQKKYNTTFKSTIAKLERKLELKLEDLKLSRIAHEDTRIRMQAQIDVLATQVAHWRDANIDFVTQRESYEKEFEKLKQSLKERQAENIAHSRKECAQVIDFLVQSMFQVFKKISHDAYNNAKASLAQRTKIAHRDVVSLKPIKPILKPRPVSADGFIADMDPDFINPSIDDYHDDSTKGDTSRVKTVKSTYSSQLSPRMNDDDDVSVLTDDASTSNFLNRNSNNYLSKDKSIQEEKKAKEVEFIQVASKIQIKIKDNRHHVTNDQISIPNNESIHDGPHVYLRTNHRDVSNPHLQYHILNENHDATISEHEMLSELESLGKEQIMGAIDIINLYFSQADDESNLDDFQMVVFGNDNDNGSITDIQKPKGKDYSSFKDINTVITEAQHGMSIWMDHASTFINKFLDTERKNFLNALDMLETEVNVMTSQNRSLQRRYEGLNWKFSEFARRNVQTSLLPVDDLRDKIFEQAIIIDRLKDESMKPLLEDIRFQAENVTRLKTMESHLKLFSLQYSEMAASKEEKCKRAASDGEAKAYRHNASTLRKKASHYKERLSNIQNEREMIVREISHKLQEFEGAVIGILPPKLLKVLNWSHNHNTNTNANNNNNVVYTPVATDDVNSIASNTNSIGKNYNHYYISSNESVASISSNSTGSSKRTGLSSSLSVSTLPANMFSTYSPSALGKMTAIDPLQKIKQLKSFKQKRY